MNLASDMQYRDYRGLDYGIGAMKITVHHGHNN